ncbi:hypothetical protein L195_g043791, partial [Trifolium pratense]
RSSLEHQILSNAQLSPILRNASKVTLVLWKTHLISWLTENIEESVICTPATTTWGGLFHDYMSNSCGPFAKNFGQVSVLYVEIIVIMMAMEISSHRGWNYLWIESDFTTSLSAFEMPNIVPWNLHNCWCNSLMLGLQITRWHIFREGNHCADKLENQGLWLKTQFGGIHYLFLFEMNFYMTSMECLVIVLMISSSLVSLYLSMG